MHRPSRPLIAGAVLCCLYAQAIAQGQEKRLDIGISSKGWLKKEGEAHALFDDGSVNGFLNYSWGAKGKLNQFRSHVRFSKSLLPQELDSDTSTILEIGQDIDRGGIKGSWDAQYVKNPGRRFDAIKVEASAKKEVTLGSKSLSVSFELNVAALQNMDGSSRDQGGNLHLGTNATLGWEQKLRAKIGPFERFEASSEIDTTKVIVGQRLRTESNFVNSVGLSGRIDRNVRVRVRLMHQNGNAAPTFPSRSRLSLRLDLTWRVKV